MAYTPTVWANGDTITATKLNKLETGLQSASPFTINNNDGTLDKTWQEIYNAMASGLLCLSLYSDQNLAELNIVMATYSDESGYHVATALGNFVATTANDYPVAD